MKIKIVVVGNLKEKYFVDAVAEYKKRLSKFCDLEIIELAEKNHLQTPQQILNQEAKDILKQLAGFVVVMDIQGKMLDSVELSKKIESIQMTNSTITFVIGSSYGLSDEVKGKANMRLSMSPMTFPHQLARVMLVEQLYRCFCISNNITYHK